MRFYQEELLWLLLLSPILVGWFILGEKSRRKRARVFFGSVKNFSMGHFKSSVYILTALSMGLVAISLSRPQKPFGNDQTKTLAMDLLLVLDVSKSMLAEDIPPNRLHVAKRKIRDLLEGLPGDRVGLVAFSGSALLVTPMTTDHLVILDFLDTLEPSIISNQGTSISEGLKRAKKAIVDSKTQSAAIILITDAEDHEDGTIQMASEISNLGIRLYAVGIGTEKGGLIPIRSVNGKFLRYKKSKSGNPIISKLSMGHLQDIARAGGGKAFASPSSSALSDILETIEKMERTEIEESRTDSFEDIFQIFLFPAVIILIIAMAVIWEYRVLAFLILLINPFNSKASFFQPEWAELSNKAIQSYRSKNYKDSVEISKMALGLITKQNSENKKASQKILFNLGMAQIRIGKHEDGIENLTKSAEGPDPLLSTKAMHNIALTYLHLKKVPEARKSLISSIVEIRKDPLSEASGRSREVLSSLPVQNDQNQSKQGEGEGEDDKNNQQQNKSDSNSGKEDEKKNKKDQNSQNQQKNKSQKRKKRFKSKKLSERQAKKMLDQLREKDRELFRKFGRRRTQGGNRSSKDW